jgi:hypothetical protein
VPLSEDEQRILTQIEQQFYDSDPQFAREVGETTLYRHAGRTLRWATVAFLAGFALLVVAFAQSLVLGFAGFLVMLVSAVVFEQSLRRMGRAGWQQVSEVLRNRPVRNRAGDLGGRVKRRFKPDK